MEKTDKTFVAWYNKKDFCMLLRMRKKYHQEYFCRTAWFARDEEIEKLEKENQKLKIEIKIVREENATLLAEYDAQVFSDSIEKLKRHK